MSNDEDDAMSLDDNDEDEDESSDSSDSESSDSDDDDDNEDDDDGDDDDEFFDGGGTDASAAPEAAVVKYENGAASNGIDTNGETKHQSQTPASAISMTPATAASRAPAATPTMVKQEDAKPVEPAPAEDKAVQQVADPQPPVAAKTEAPAAAVGSNHNDIKTTNGIKTIVADDKKEETAIMNDVTMEDMVDVVGENAMKSDTVMTEAASPEAQAAPSEEIKELPKPSIETQPKQAIDQNSSSVPAASSQTVAPSETKPKPTLKIKLKLGNKAAKIEANAKPASIAKPASMQNASKTTEPSSAEPASTATTNVIGAINGNAVSTTASMPHSTTGEPPPKKKKLSLVLKIKKPPTEKETSAGTTSTAEVKAEVVDDNDGKAADVVAKVIDNPATVATASTNTTTTTKVKKKAPSLFKPARLPPMTSPGMLLSHNAAGISQASSALFRAAMDKKTCLANPSVLFDKAMESVGYTTEERTKNPHRGSSVQKKVGDMFDSNVAFTAYFPELVPSELWNTHPQQQQKQQQNQPENKDTGSAGGAGEGTGAAEVKLSLPEMLLKSLRKDIKKTENEGKDDSSQNIGGDHGGRKRPRPLQFKDMIPVSLTLPYPESFLNQSQQYVKKVQERERAIVLYQEAQEKLDNEREERELLYGKAEHSGEQPKPVNSVIIPPIPSVPTPPLLSELKGFDAEQYEDKYPLYFPKGKSSFVAHLDPNCFHVSEGRYFGLSSNMIADPHFVGASAPGLSAQTLSVGSALATASTNSQGTGALLSGPMPTTSLSSSSKGTSSNKVQKKGSGTVKSTKKASVPGAAIKSSSKSSIKGVGLTATANTSDLRKVMEKNDEMTKKMKDCIIRAAVHSIRGEKHGLAFLGPDGNIYADVSKAFAAHAGMKPCSRCKNNKQGAYHCRLRRKHQEADFDGDHSSSELDALMKVPMEELVLNRKDLDT